MASDLWKLAVDGGAAATLGSLGIRAARVTRPVLDVGTLTFLVKVDSISTAAPFTYGQELVLTRAAAVWFVGRVRSVAAGFNRGESVWSITVCDAWWEMEHTVYRQPAVAYNDTFSALVGYLTSRVALNQDAWGRQLTQGEQIENAINYAIAQAPDTIVLGAVPALTAEWSKEETREITVAEAVRRAAALAPTAFATRSYSASGMTIAFAARADLTLATLDLDLGTIVEEVSGLRRRDDLIPPGVVFDFLTSALDPDEVDVLQVTRQYAGTPGGPGTIYASFKLGPCDTIPVGAATAYYNALTDAQWEGDITLKELECSGSVAPGNRVRLTNGQAAWATMDAVVQSVTEDLDTGRTSIELGPPDVLGLDDFIGQLNRFRNRPAPTGICDVAHNGTEGVAGGIDDTGAAVSTVGDGVSSPVTGNAPGVGSPAANAAAGRGGVAYNGTEGGQMGSAQLTLCDGQTINVVTRI